MKVKYRMSFEVDDTDKLATIIQLLKHEAVMFNIAPVIPDGSKDAVPIKGRREVDYDLKTFASTSGCAKTVLEHYEVGQEFSYLGAGALLEEAGFSSNSVGALMTRLKRTGHVKPTTKGHYQRLK